MELLAREFLAGLLQLLQQMGLFGVELTLADRWIGDLGGHGEGH